MNVRPDILRQQAAAAKHIKDAVAGHDDEELTLDSIEGETDFLAIMDRLMDAIAETESMAEAIKTRETELKARRERMIFRIEKMRKLAESAMMIADMRKLERAEYTLSLRKGSPQVHVYDEGSIPEAFYKQPPPVLDKTKLKDALSNGDSVPGVSLTNGQPSLAVRRK